MSLGHDGDLSRQEVLGSAIGLYLLFGIPILWGVIITAFAPHMVMFGW